MQDYAPGLDVLVVGAPENHSVGRHEHRPDLCPVSVTHTHTWGRGGEYGNPAFRVAFLGFGDREAEAGLVVHGGLCL